MKRQQIGGILWMGSCLYLPAQVLTALRWPRPYSWTDNFISDLGETACGVYPEPGLPTREICSPWHAVFNTATTLSGVLTVMGAVLLTGWWRGRCGWAGTALVALHGSLTALVGLLPWDRHPDAHNAVALWQAVALWCALGLLAVSTPGRFRYGTLAVAVVSVVGFALFASAGVEASGLGIGGSERLAFDVPLLWFLLTGAAIALRPSPLGRR